MRRSLSRGTVVLAAALVTMAIAAPSAGAATQRIRIFPNNPTVGNCEPFGGGGVDPWTPYAAFFYKSIPAFQLLPGDTLAFDLGLQNDADIQLQIDVAPAVSNGSNVQAQPFTKIVSNTQTPANPRGDTTVGDFELRFTIEAPFNFAGGGLIIRFSNPSAAYATDTTCDQVMVNADSTDSSGFFVGRAYNDADGVAPWDYSSTGPVGAFQIVPGAFTVGKPTLNKKRGTAIEPVSVPGPGTVTLTGNGVASQSLAGARSSVAVNGPTTVNLPVKPQGKKKRKLTRTGKAKVNVTVTFAPTDGNTNSHQAKIKLKKSR